MLESIRGKIGSWRVVSPILGLYCREMNAIISQSYARNKFLWKKKDFESFQLDDEFLAWKELKLLSLKRKWRTFETQTIEPENFVYTDASKFACGGLLFDEADSEQIGLDRYFVFNNEQNKEPIHVKELLAVYATLWSFRESISNKNVVLFCDNMSVVSSFNRTQNV